MCVVIVCYRPTAGKKLVLLQEGGLVIQECALLWMFAHSTPRATRCPPLLWPEGTAPGTCSHMVSPKACLVMVTFGERSLNDRG